MPKLPVAAAAGQLAVLSCRFPPEQLILIMTWLVKENTREAFETSMRKHGFTADLEQTLLPPFRSLLYGRPGVRDRLLALQDLGVPNELVEPYFTDMGMRPDTSLRHNYGRDQAPKWADRFIEAARDLVFAVLHEWATRIATIE